jgi:hypothetical protein
VEGRNHSEDTGIDGRIILKGVYKEYGGQLWNGFMWLRIGTSGEIL